MLFRSLRWITEAEIAEALEAVLNTANPRPRRDPEIKPSTVRIGARKLRCRLRHVVLERDVYYRSQKHSEPTSPPEQGKPTQTNPFCLAHRQRNHVWPGWGTAGCPILLRPDRTVDGRRYAGEYFMLGDNSPASKDSRLWWEIGPHLQPLGQEYQVGTVPGDQLIGKAFFVYWPAGYRLPGAVARWLRWIPAIGPLVQETGICPNAGRMRWIR